MSASHPTAFVLNELSLTEPQQTDATLLNLFSALLANLRALVPQAYLVSPIALWGDGANPSTTFGTWANDARNRDKLRQIIALQNRAPFESEFGILDPGLPVDYEFDGAFCVGLGYAHSRQIVAISLETRDEFTRPLVEIERITLDEYRVDVQSEYVSARNASNGEHLQFHKDHLGGSASLPASGAELWERRAEVFERIAFLSRAESDISDLEGAALRAVWKRLNEMEEALARWDPASGGPPPWGSKVTPDSSSRVNAGKCDFKNEEGIVETFSLHARFTPGAGRIHFALNAQSATIVVAYVGSKLF